MTETLEMKINKNTEIVFDFYVDKILSLVKIKNKNVILIGLGNTKFIKLIKSVAKNVCIIDHCLPFERDYKLTDEYQLEIDIKKYLEKNNMPKFDVAIMNPPYDDGSPMMAHIDEKIVLKIKDFVKYGICIDMAGWFLDKTNKKRNKEKEHCVDFINSAEIIKKDEFNKIFNIGASQDGFIFTFTDTKSDWFDNNWDNENPIYKILDNSPGFFNDNFVCNHGKIVKNNNTIYLKRKTFNKNDKFLFEYNEIKGAIYQYDYECKFRTKNEKLNFINSFETIFMKFIMSQIRTGRIIRLTGIPFMSDYSQPWDDKRFCEYFGISGYIDDDHAEPCSEWETILNTMKKYA